MTDLPNSAADRAANASTPDAETPAIQSLDLLDDARIHEIVDDLARGGPAHPGDVRELSAARRLALQKLPEDGRLIGEPQARGDRRHAQNLSRDVMTKGRADGRLEKRALGIQTRCAIM